jgi:cell division protein FtsW
MGVTLALFTFGLLTLSSATTFKVFHAGEEAPRYVLKQAMGGALGLAALVVCSRIPVGWWKKMAWPILGATWLMLLVLVIPGTHAIAPVINESRRWLVTPIGRIQPSELAKVSIVIWTAALAVKKQAHFQSLRKGLLPFLVVWGSMMLLVQAEPDMSTACLLGLLAAVVVFAAGGRIAHFLFLGVLLLPLLVMKLGTGYWFERMKAFLDPGSDPQGIGFQVHQSLIAIGSGGWTGVGFGEGRQKFGFLPEPHNDFIFAMIGEEWGLMGVVLVVSLFMTLIMVGFRIAQRAPDLFSELLAIGLTSLIAIQALLHMGVGLSLVPNTGLALPLISYGRSNLLVTMASIGILMAVARTQREGGRRRG